jgi:hypothetical protein
MPYPKPKNSEDIEMSIEIYQTRLQALDLENFSVSVDTVADAKAALAEIKRIQGELRQIKKEISAEITAIRASYRQKTAQASNEGFGRELFGKRNMARKQRPNKTRRISSEQDRVLAPYEDLKVYIERALVGLDGLRSQATTFTEQIKAEETETKAAQPSNGKFCPQCGNSVKQDDRFCSKCGEKLS